jgi:hypothetical protein
MSKLASEYAGKVQVHLFIAMQDEVDQLDVMRASCFVFCVSTDFQLTFFAVPPRRINFRHVEH